MTAALTLDGLRKSFGKTEIIRGVDLSIAKNERHAIIGPNGAGKSTLVKALCGRIRPTSGHIHIQGDLVRHRSEKRHLIGLVPQQVGLYPHLTGRENLDVFARLCGVDAKSRNARVQEALDTVDMSPRANRKVEHMSGGMQRRINVAAAILRQPPVIVFDEPTAGVDHPARDVIHQLARKLSQSGHAVILVTHELEQAEGLCDNVLVLEAGRVRYFAPPSDLLTSHFQNDREVVVRFRRIPEPSLHSAIRSFGFETTELPTMFRARTQSSEVNFVSAFMGAFGNRDAIIREVTVRRPGLASLMRELEAR